jgi:toxin CptA
MHSAPSVSYPVGRSRLGATLMLGAWVLGAGAAAWWWAQVQPATWRAMAAAGLLLASGVAAGWSWACTPRSTLAWDGDSWSWSGQQDASGTLEVVLDLQRLLLVRWRSPAGAGWLWLERPALPARWDDLRRAVYSRAGPEAPPGAQSPRAKP